MESLTGLRERRMFECRLTPDRALLTLDEAEEFLPGRGLLTRTADCVLPSLHELVAALKVSRQTINAFAAASGGRPCRLRTTGRR